MRVTTSLKYEIGIAQIQRLQSKQLHNYEQSSTGRRVVRPGDDPLAASQAVTISQNISLNARYTENRSIATQSLGMVDTAIQSSVDILEGIKEKLIAAGNGSYSDADIKAIGAELSSSLASLLTQANATDGSGVYLFSGNKGDAAPYTVDADGYVEGDYQGDDGQRLVQVDQTRQISTSNTADEIYGSVFDDLKNIIQAIENYDSSDSTSVATFQSTLETVQENVDDTYNNIVTIGTSVGARMNEVSALDTIGASRQLSYESQLNDLVNISEVETYSMTSYYALALQASIQSFLKIESMNLFNNS